MFDIEVEVMKKLKDFIEISGLICNTEFQYTLIDWRFIVLIASREKFLIGYGRECFATNMMYFDSFDG